MSRCLLCPVDRELVRKAIEARIARYEAQKSKYRRGEEALIARILIDELLDLRNALLGVPKPPADDP